MKFLAIIFGFLVGSITFWFEVFTETFLGMNVYFLLVILAFILSFIPNMFYRKNLLLYSLLLWAGAEAAVLGRAIYDITFIDPGSHNLLGLEIVLTSICILPSAIAGAFFTKVFPEGKGV